MGTKSRVRRALARAAVVSVAAATLAEAALFAVPMQRAYAAGLTPGNLLVSTSVYDDVPAITAGTTALPVQASVFVTGVTTSGAPPNIVATITSLSKNTGFAAGQTVTIANVGGATQVNGSRTIVSVAANGLSFTVNMGSTAVSPYTSGGTASVPLDPTAVAGGLYPTVFNNASVDANFGITEPIVLDQIPAVTTLVSTPISQFTVPNSDTAAANQMVTSFSSKSEVALNQSTDGTDVSFMGYNAPTAAIDVSNSNTPTAPEMDPTNSDTAGPSPLKGYYRDVATMDVNENIQFTETAAYPGNNGRAAVLNASNNTLFLAGNAGNGANPPFQGVVGGAGSQIAAQASTSQAAQEAAGVPVPSPYGNFNITQAGDAADKTTKDDNFRGLAQSNGVIYMSKGSGGNGINTVYFVDTTGQTCSPSGLPGAGASLPAAGSWTPPAYSTSNAALGLTATNPGLAPVNMCILKGFPTQLASVPKGQNYTVYFPFGIWFANSTTLYVADEGSGTGAAATDTTGGLQKWTFNAASGSWVLDYTLTGGLNLLTPYASAINPSPAGVNGDASPETYPTGNNGTAGVNGGTGKPWTPSTDGLRNIVGQVNSDGTVTIWGVTSTVSGSGDQGADPNSVVAITDNLAATTLPAGEAFSTVMAPTDGVVYRGVSFTPGSSNGAILPEVPWAPLLPVTGGLAVGALFMWQRRRRRLVA